MLELKVFKIRVKVGKKVLKQLIRVLYSSFDVISNVIVKMRV